MTATSLSNLDVALSSAADEIAPDGSQVRVLCALPRGSMGHFTIPAGQTIRAVRHKSVDEIWYVLEGQGEMWRRFEHESSIVPMSPGASLAIPVRTTFQVRNSGADALCILGQTMPAWPGNDEAEYVDGPWPATLTGPK